MAFSTATTGTYSTYQPNPIHGPSQVPSSGSPISSTTPKKEYNPLLQSGSMRVLPLLPVVRNPDPNVQNRQNQPHLVVIQNRQVFAIPNPLQSVQSNSLLSASARLSLHEGAVSHADSSVIQVPTTPTTLYANTASTSIPSTLSAPSVSLCQSVSTSELQ